MRMWWRNSKRAAPIGVVALEGSLDRPGARRPALAHRLHRSGQPAAADKVAERTLETAGLLERFPHAGRLHAESGARILAVRRTSLLLIYDVEATEVRLLHVRHMAQLPYGEGD